jgi:hypothetical protein
MARLTDGTEMGRLRPASSRPWLSVTLLAALLGWGDLALAQPAATINGAGTSEDEGAELVACLLPADIDRFGRQLTIVGARQKIETSRADCQARGGEVIDGGGPAGESTESGR